jgi:acetyl-CoA acetyltransferase family protein
MANNRVAIAGGARTPFVKAGTVFSKYRFQDLSALVISDLLKKYELDAVHIDEIIWSTVLLDPRTPNWAREILFKAGVPKSVYAYSVSNNCISGLVALTCAAEKIHAGRAKMSIAGGAESMSNPSLLFSEKASDNFLSLFQARTLGERMKLLTRFRPGDFLPNPPSVTEPSTGLTMGQHMELTAKELGITRESQDEVAYRSHIRAGEATTDGRLKEFITPVDGLEKDLLVRADTSIEKLSGLKPVFDRSSAGTLTAGNSSPLTDGASGVLLLSEDEAEKQGREVLAYLKDYEYSAIDPKEGLLMAPAVAVPRLLMRNNLTLADFDLVEIHEAFGAQVVANEKAWAEGLKEEAVGTVDKDKVNVLGGSIAIGHPFAATGGRIVMHLAAEMKRRDAKRGLVSICAAGAMAGALILERD